MENVKSALGYLLAIVVIWHIKVAVSDETKLVGFFKVQPAKPGFTWNIANTNDNATDSTKATDDATVEDIPTLPSREMTEPHFFWQNNSLKWYPGMLHPDFKVEAATEINTWKPLPGYAFIQEGTLHTQWRAGQLHPTYKVISSSSEGTWNPALGYEFNNSDPDDLHVHWAPGKNYPDRKITSAQQNDTFTAFPGYTFTNPAKTLEVVWTPGLPNPNDPNQISGSDEGTWVTYDEQPPSTEPTPSTHVGNAITYMAVGKTIEWLLGENDLSDALSQEAGKEVGKAIIKKITE